MNINPALCRFQIASIISASLLVIGFIHGDAQIATMAGCVTVTFYLSSIKVPLDEQEAICQNH